MPASANAPVLLHAAFNSLPFGVVILARDGRVVWQNARFDALDPALPEALRPAMASDEPWRGETTWRRSDGAWFPAKVTVDSLDREHRMVTIRELPAGEMIAREHCHLIAENAVDVIWLWDVVHERLAFVSPSVEPLLGKTPLEAMQDGPAEMMTPESFERASVQLAEWIAEVEAGDESSRTRTNEFEYRHKDGTVVPIETATRLISNADGRIQYVLGVSRDFRARKAAEEAMAAAEEKYRTIFDGAMEGMYRTSINGRPLAVNAAAARILGFDSPEDLLETVTDIGGQLWVSRTERERFMSMLDEQGTVRSFECAQRRKDGQIAWISLNTHRVRGPNGDALYNEGFMEEVTERKRMQYALQQSEEKLAKLFMASPALNSIHDIHDGGRILDVNERFEQVTGYLREEVVGRTVREIGWLPDPATGPIIENALLTDGRIRNLEHRFRTKSGEIRTALLSAERIELGGRMCSISARFDITERQQTQERLENLATAIEQAAEQIVITDPEGKIQYCNPAFEKTTGYARDEVLGQNPRILKSGKQASEFYKNLWATIKSGKTWSGRFTNRRKNESTYEEEATISPVRDAAGEVRAYVAVKRDVSERLHLESQLRQAQKLESIGRLAGGVAHDFNNLLTIINGYADLVLAKVEREDPLRAYADEIRKAGQRAAGLTRQLLAFSRKQVFEVRTLDVNAIVRDTERMLRRLIGEDIELVTRLEADLGAVKGDHDQLHQVIMNLAVNARDAMPNGGRLTIETRNYAIAPGAGTHPDASPGRYVVMCISDTGSGMDDETLESIFEPFFTTKEQGKGTGLGLSTVYGIVRQNGGWIEVSSELGSGTVFRVILPRVEPDPETERIPAVQEAAPQGGETVLVVEDQEEVRRLARRILVASGYRVLEAANGAEAYVRAREHAGPIDLLLTDVVMPGSTAKSFPSSCAVRGRG